MGLKFNTFRAQRYLRSRFVEGKYLLASEGTDIELELIDLTRSLIKSSIGDVAIDDSWKVERLSSTQVLVKPGEAWVSGLPFHMRSGKDHLVSGSTLLAGIVPAGVAISDDSTGLGKIITFSTGTTPTDLYRVVVTAQEELITFNEDPFLQNANLTEDTEQKLRLVYKINIVSDSDQDESPIPYANDTSGANLVNQITVTPAAAGNGELLAINIISGSEKIDGRDLELVLRNNPGLGGGNPIPNGTIDQQAFYNGLLIDSYGTEYWVNAVFNDTVSTQVVIRIDKEVNQPNPQIVNGVPFTLVKRDVYSTDDTNGAPLGKLFYPISTVNFNISTGIVSDDDVVDLRKIVASDENLREDLVYYMSSAFLRSDSPVVWTGTQLEFTDDIILETRDPSTGNLTLHTIDTSDSPIVLADGEYIYVVVDRSLDETLTPLNSGTNPFPSVNDIAKDVFVLFKRQDIPAGGYLHIPLHKQVLRQGQSAYLGASGSGGTGIVQADLYDSIDTTLPTGPTLTLDGESLVDGDIVLFSNLSVNNNRLYQASGVGVSIVWTPVFGFANGIDVGQGELIYVKRGDSFANQIGKFTDPDWEFNKTTRYFDGLNYVEFESLKTTTLVANSTADVFSVTASGSENWVIPFSVTRGTTKVSGIMHLNHDNTDASVSWDGAETLSDLGIDFDANVSAGNLHLEYTADNSGPNATMKFFYYRWSDSAGGPGGVPSYTAFSSSSIAAGNPTEVQFNTAGFLDADSQFKWDSVNKELNLNGLRIGARKGPLTLADNQASPVTLFNIDAVDNKYTRVKYSISRNGNERIGTLYVLNNGSTSFEDDVNFEVGVTGITLTTQYSAGLVNIQYTSDSQGVSGTFKYSLEYWD